MAKNVNKITQPKINERPEVHYMGIRIQTPFRGMFKQIGLIQRELETWFKDNKIEQGHPRFLRYHVIDMQGEMDMEYGIPVDAPLPDEGQVRAGIIPAGRYISLIYAGSGLQGNKALLGYIQENNIPADRWESDKGDVFASRFEAYLTDPKVEPRKTKWDIELAIKLKDE